MTREIDENIAKALETINTLCNKYIDKSCVDCPFTGNRDNEHFCYLSKTVPCCWNFREEKKYIIEYKD